MSYQRITFRDSNKHLHSSIDLLPRGVSCPVSFLDLFNASLVRGCKTDNADRVVGGILSRATSPCSPIMPKLPRFDPHQLDGEAKLMRLPLTQNSPCFDLGFRGMNSATQSVALV